MKKGATEARVGRVHGSSDVALVSAQSLSISLRYHLPVLEAVAAQGQPRAPSDHSQYPAGKAGQATLSRPWGPEAEEVRPAPLSSLLFPPSWSPLRSLQPAFLKRISSFFNSSHTYHYQLPPHCAPEVVLSSPFAQGCKVPVRLLICCVPQGKSGCLLDSQISIHKKGMLAPHKAVWRLK